MVSKEEALAFHTVGRPGKIEVVPTKPAFTQRDLSLAYSPGVAEPCREIDKNPEECFRYTAKGNLVAVISNGTAVLGLGDIGPLAGKPVMEGKGVLFKRFADIDVFDLEVDSKDIDEICRVVRALEPTFGGINLEDIKAPDCFVIEERLKGEMDIPVFHDDQHGTAIISAAALINWGLLRKREMSEVKVVFSGAGAAAISCAKLYQSIGVRVENMIICDSKGVISKARADEVNEFKRPFAVETDAKTLAEAMKGADVFVGLSLADLVTPEMLKEMNEGPLVLALANPDPEIPYDVARATRPDAICGTGRSDFPNQVNNVLGFPFIFRGALDVRARKINEEMKIAAVNALAELAREDVPESVSRAYSGEHFEFGDEYIIPKPMDPRVLTRVAPAVAKAAIDSGVARTHIEDWEEYRYNLRKRLGQDIEVLHFAMQRAKGKGARVVFPEGEDERILRAAALLVDNELGKPVLVGRREDIEAEIQAHDALKSLADVEIHDPIHSPHYEQYIDAYHEMRQRKGTTRATAARSMSKRFDFAAMMLNQGHADGMVTGATASFSEVLTPAFSLAGMHEPGSFAAGAHMIMHKGEVYFFADTTALFDPTAQQLAAVGSATVDLARRFNIEPRVAMLSFSSFGSAKHPEVDKVRHATEILRRCCPDVPIEGEIQADVALRPDLQEEQFPFSKLGGRANVLIFPNLASANIAYKLVESFGASISLGPFLVGMKKPVTLVMNHCDVTAVYRSAAIAAMLSQSYADHAP
jgi:malate dehydrogenase (oxaloacetate-decarboxylating)(NADP+)